MQQPKPMNVVVIGAAGAFGGATARELLRRGHSVRALMRPGGRRPEIRGAEIAVGDALDRESLLQAARGVDAIVFGFHVPYDKWFPTCIEAAKVTAEVAALTRATVLFPGNVYGLGPDFSEPLAENCAREAPTRKGEIRNAMEELLKQATERGARAIIVRAGDYLDPDSTNTLFELMAFRSLTGGPMLQMGPAGVPHAWAYMPDVVRAGVDLLERRDSLDAFEQVNIEGYSLDSEQMLGAMQTELGSPRRVWSFPWWLLRLLGPLYGLARELYPMRYLWQVPLTLDGSKLRRVLPDFRATPLEVAVEQSLRGIARRKGLELPSVALASRNGRVPDCPNA